MNGARTGGCHYTVPTKPIPAVITRVLRQQSTPPVPHLRPSGFTLLEMTVVLVIVGLVGGLVLTRAPQRGGRQDLQAATALVTGTLRGARSRAMVADRTVAVRFDPVADTVQLGAEAVRRLPPGIRIAAVAPPAILFRPDGSSTGGTVDLAGRADTARVAVNWLTGRVAAAGKAPP